MAERLTAVFTPPAGFARIGILSAGESLCALRWLSVAEASSVPGRAIPNPLVAEIVKQLAAYFADPHWCFTLPLQLAGSAFQRRVWQALRDIPAGTTCSYGVLAERLQTSPRAIGGACRANPVPIVIPCHRVVSVSGPGGYCGRTRGALWDIKRRLLAHESPAGICSED